MRAGWNADTHFINCADLDEEIRDTLKGCQGVHAYIGIKQSSPYTETLSCSVGLNPQCLV